MRPASGPHIAHGLVTIFGGSGFLGRHVVRRLAARNAHVRVAVRDPETVEFEIPQRDGGQVNTIYADVRDEASVSRAVGGAAAVVNAVGLYVERGKATFDAVHNRGALHVAQQSAQAGVERLIHISGIGAEVGSPSKYVRSRAEGERMVREAFGAATILRPSLMFGPGDSFFQTLADLSKLAPAIPLIGGGQSQVQPVYVGDVAAAIVKVLAEPSAKGTTYELGGPQVLTYRDLTEILLNHLEKSRILLPVPYAMASSLATLFKLLPDPPLTHDQLTLMKSDNVVGSTVLTFADLGMEPTAVEDILPTYIKPRHRGGRLPGSKN